MRRRLAIVSTEIFGNLEALDLGEGVTRGANYFNELCEREQSGRLVGRTFRDVHGTAGS